MARSAVALEHRRMDYGTVELLPFVRVAGATETVFGFDQTKRIATISRQVAVRAELLCHWNMGDLACKPLLGRRMRIMAVGASVQMHGIIGMGFRECPFRTVMAFTAQFERRLLEESCLIRCVRGVTLQALGLLYRRMNVLLGELFLFLYVTDIAQVFVAYVQQFRNLGSVGLVTVQAEPIVHRAMYMLGAEFRGILIVTFVAIPVLSAEDQILMIGGMRVVTPDAVAKVHGGMDLLPLPRVLQFFVACITELLIALFLDNLLTCGKGIRIHAEYRKTGHESNYYVSLLNSH